MPRWLKRIPTSRPIRPSRFAPRTPRTTLSSASSARRAPARWKPAPRFWKTRASRPSLSQGGNKTFFRVVPNDDVQGPTDGNYIADKIGAKNVYVLDDKESYG